MPTPFSLSSALEFVRVGIETNLWGLACPFHCGPPSAAALGLAFLSGFGLGFGAGLVLVILLAFRFGFHLPSWGPSAPDRSRPTPGPPPSLNRIQAYLYE